VGMRDGNLADWEELGSSVTGFVTRGGPLLMSTGSALPCADTLLFTLDSNCSAVHAHGRDQLVATRQKTIPTHSMARRSRSLLRGWSPQLRRSLSCDPSSRPMGKVRSHSFADQTAATPWDARRSGARAELRRPASRATPRSRAPSMRVGWFLPGSRPWSRPWGTVRAEAS